MTSYQLHVKKALACTLCPLHETRKRVVIARGQMNENNEPTLRIPARVLFIGEAPGESEDVLGYPFAGPAGGLINHIIAEAWEGRSVTYAMTNLLCCIPVDETGRKATEPEKKCVKACEPRLVDFVRICRPELIILVGKAARQYVYGAAQFRLDGKAEQPEWIPEGKFLHLEEILHPAFILRANEAMKEVHKRRCVVQLRVALNELEKS